MKVKNEAERETERRAIHSERPGDDKDVSLEESVRRLQIAMRAARMGVWEVDLVKDTQTWDEQYWRIFGSPRNPPQTTEEFFQFVHPEDHARLYEAFDRSINENRDYEVEYRIFWPDGQMRWHSAVGHPLFDENGRPTKMLGVGHDITERKQAEEELRLSEERLATVLKAGRMGSWIWDIDTQTSIYNQQEYELLGLEPIEGPVNTDIYFERVHPDDRDELGRKARYAMEHPGYFEHDFRIIRPDGEVRWLAGRGKVVTDESTGAPRQMFGVNYDITEQKRHEEELENTNYLLEMVLNNIPQGVFWKDRNSIYLGSNKLVGSMAGFDEPSEIIGKSDFELPNVNREQAELFRSKDREVMETGVPQAGIVVSGRLPNGRQVWLETNKVPLRDSGGEIVGVLGTFSEITERRRLEEQLRQSQKMEAFGQLAAGVAHDFNNLLTVITGYSDILLMKLPEDDPLRSAVVSIGDASERAAALTRQLLAFSRLTVLDPRVTDLNRIIEEMDRILRRLIGEKIDFSCSLSEDLWPVKVDQSQIGQVLLNLVINARDSMPEGGTLTILTRNVSNAAPANAAPGNYVILAVTDTGTGIPENDLGRIFEPFFTTKGPGKGTGLGLAVVDGIVKQSGGAIEVESTPNGGSTFIIYLPAVDGELQHANVKRSEADTAEGRETILLVDDEETVRKYTRYSLEEKGYKVLAAANGPEAIEIAEERGDQIDLLLTDVVMPGIDGRRLAEKLTARFPHLKVLFVSGYTNDAVVRDHILHNDVAFLQKPYTPAALASKVREVLDS